MLSRYRDYDETLVILREEERPWGFLLHALAWVPVWGFVVSMLLWVYYRHRSREMVFHIQQAIQLQITVLVPVLLWIVGSILTEVVKGVSPGMGAALATANDFVAVSLLTLMAAVAVVGGGLVYLGKGFLYPVIGRRVLEGTLRKYTED